MTRIYYKWQELAQLHLSTTEICNKELCPRNNMVAQRAKNGPHRLGLIEVMNIQAMIPPSMTTASSLKQRWTLVPETPSQMRQLTEEARIVHNRMGNKHFQDKTICVKIPLKLTSIQHNREIQCMHVRCETFILGGGGDYCTSKLFYTLHPQP